MLRTVLVALDDSPYTEVATSLAIDWGKRFGARLIGLGILDEPSITAAEPVPLGASSFKRERDEALIADAHRRVLGFLSEFQKRSHSAGVANEAIEHIGESAATILREAHRCDVVMLGRETHFRFETQDTPDTTLARVLRGSPRPVVVVPQKLPAGSGVVVAYGGGREVASALQTFQLLGLAGGETIHLVSVQREGWEAEAFARLASDFLDAHGAAYKLHKLQSGEEPARVLLEQVRALRPRLLVMGAHGYHPLRDLFATSVTRAVLNECPVPVFIGA
jgi:nucleotide-binding universal stress UspA family protein